MANATKDPSVYTHKDAVKQLRKDIAWLDATAGEYAADADGEIHDVLSMNEGILVARASAAMEVARNLLLQAANSHGEQVQ